MRGSNIRPRLSAAVPYPDGCNTRLFPQIRRNHPTTVANHPARILLVDDEQSIQTLLSYPLRKDGYDVVQATDGREALERFDEQPFDLVVLDLMLPRLDGLEVRRQLRRPSSGAVI